MYCGECGAKLEKDATFCSECGTKVEKPKEKTPPKETPVRQVTPRQPMSKTKKIILGVCVVVVVVLALGYNYLSEKFGPKGVVKEYFEAVVNKDVDVLYDFLDIEGDKTFVSKDKFKSVMESKLKFASGGMLNMDISKYQIDKVIYGDGKLSAKVTVNYTSKNSNEEATTTVYLTKGKGKQFFIFDNWELKEGYESILVKDYEIKVPAGSKVTVDKIDLDEKYLDKDNSSKVWDVYKIPQMFSSEIAISANIAGFEVTDTVAPTSYSYASHTLSLELDNLSKEDVEKLETQVKTDITTLYQNLIEKKNWDAVKDSYNFKDADLEELQEEYESLYESVAENSSRTLKEFEVTSMKVNGLSSEDDGMLRVGIKFNYNYKIDYKRYDDSIEEKTGKNSSNSTLYYQYSDGQLKLVDASYLVSYFSAY